MAGTVPDQQAERKTMKTTIQKVWFQTKSGKAYTFESDNYADWKEAHSSALFQILRAVKRGAKITVNQMDWINADWTADYQEGFSCRCIMTTEE